MIPKNKDFIGLYKKGILKQLSKFKFYVQDRLKLGLFDLQSFPCLFYFTWLYHTPNSPWSLETRGNGMN